MGRRQIYHTKKSSAPTRDTPYYVTMTDRFMSNWGKAKGKINKLVIPCTSYQQAQIVKRNALDRGEQKHVNIRRTKPYYPRRSVYLSVASKKRYKNWFKKSRPFRKKEKWER